MRRRWTILGLVAAMTVALCGCNHTHIVRLQPDAIEVGPGLRPVAGIQANAISAYVLFVPIPGGVSLDRVVNQMLVIAAKTMGADKVAQLHFEITPSGGVWALRKVLGWRSAKATGIAVQVTGPAPDPGADQGPEPAGVTPDRQGAQGGNATPAPAPATTRR